MNINGPTGDDPDKQRGLYRKFRVTRTDPDAQARHADCDYFVLDLQHDRLAIPALAAYEAAAMAAGYNDLAEDLRLKRAALNAKLTNADVQHLVGDPRGNPR